MVAVVSLSLTALLCLLLAALWHLQLAGDDRRSLPARRRTQSRAGRAGVRSAERRHARTGVVAERPGWNTNSSGTACGVGGAFHTVLRSGEVGADRLGSARSVPLRGCARTAL